MYVTLTQTADKVTVPVPGRYEDTLSLVKREFLGRRVTVNVEMGFLQPKLFT
jgi:hypothetical protein